MNLKVPGAILKLGYAILSTRAKTVWGVVATPLRGTRDISICCIVSMVCGDLVIESTLYDLKLVGFEPCHLPFAGCT